jgi:hypothetical protein
MRQRGCRFGPRVFMFRQSASRRIFDILSRHGSPSISNGWKLPAPVLSNDWKPEDRKRDAAPPDCHPTVTPTASPHSPMRLSPAPWIRRNGSQKNLFIRQFHNYRSPAVNSEGQLFVIFSAAWRKEWGGQGVNTRFRGPRKSILRVNAGLLSIDNMACGLN